jgi:N-terminal acetyltransferase B complex catalytic subunit
MYLSPLPFSEKWYDGYFVDLFVRVSNNLAINMYTKFGYSVYRQVIGYYSGEEDAYGALQPAAAACVCVEPVCSMCHAHMSIARLFMCRYWLTFCMVADMRKALARDIDKKSIIPLDHPVNPEDLDF